MKRNRKNTHWSQVVCVALLTTAVIGCAAAGRATRPAGSTGERTTSRSGETSSTTVYNDGTTTSDVSASAMGQDDKSDYTEPALWVFGVQSSPKLANEIGAGGVRGIVDIRKFKPAQYAAVLKKYADLDLGFCITLRWKAATRDGAKAKGAERVDVPPTPAEAKKSIEQLITFFNTPAGKKLSGKLYVQIFNEISGGPGRFGEAEEDPMFAYAIQLAKRIRQDAPHVKIIGPALTGVDVLDAGGSDDFKGIQKLRYQRLLRTIKWSAQYGDAVDLHLHEASGADANKALKIVRRVLDRQPGGKETEIVAMEWSCARFTSRTDATAVTKTLNDIWAALVENGVTVAAYGAYWPGKNQRDQYQWKSLVDLSGKPQQPFHNFFTGLARKQREAAKQGN